MPFFFFQILGVIAHKTEFLSRLDLLESHQDTTGIVSPHSLLRNMKRLLVGFIPHSFLEKMMT